MPHTPPFNLELCPSFPSCDLAARSSSFDRAGRQFTESSSCIPSPHHETAICGWNALKLALTGHTFASNPLHSWIALFVIRHQSLRFPVRPASQGLEHVLTPRPPGSRVSTSPIDVNQQSDFSPCFVRPFVPDTVHSCLVVTCVGYLEFLR